jgi:hypothetical protein
VLSFKQKSKQPHVLCQQGKMKRGQSKKVRAQKGSDLSLLFPNSDFSKTVTMTIGALRAIIQQ